MRGLRRARLWAACLTVLAVTALLAPSAASAGTLTSATFTTAATGYAITSAQNTRYDYGFTTATAATISRVGATVPTGTNSYSPRYLALNANGYASTGTLPAGQITGDFDVRFAVAVNNWSQATEQSYVGRWGGGQLSFLFTSNNGNAYMLLAPNNSTVYSCNVMSVSSYTANSLHWLRATVQFQNGTAAPIVTYYTSSDGTSWTQNSQSNCGGAMNTTNTTTTVGYSVGAQATGSAPIKGRIYYSDVRNGISGTTTSPSTCAGTLYCFNPNDYLSGSSFISSSPTAETWTVSRSGANLPADIASDLTVNSISGLPAGGTAVYRMIDGAAIYTPPTPTSVAASTPCAISLSGFTNTATAGSYTSTITTYDNSGTPVAIDSATTGALVFAAASNTSNVSATIDPTMTFTVAGITGYCAGVALTGTATVSSVNLGHINSSSPVSAAQQITAYSNAGGNVVVYTRFSGLLNDGSGHTIADVPSDGGWPNAVSYPATGTAAFGYSFGWLGTNKWIRMTTSNTNNLSWPNPNGSDCIVYRAQAAPTTPAGSYSTTVYYTAVPTF